MFTSREEGEVIVVRTDTGICYGTDVATGKRITFSHHAHAGKMMQVRGETGGGKSVLMSTLLMQFIQSYVVDGQEVIDPVVVIDLGGDLFTANLLLDECMRIGRTFKWFSLDPLDDCFTFDPLQSCKSLAGSCGRKANFVTAGLNLAYSEGFGTGYFGRLNLSTIREAFVRLEAKGIASPTLIELGEELTLMARRNRNNREAAEALYALDQLLDYSALTQSADPDWCIDVDQALEESHVLYYFLPTLQETLAARATGTLAAWSVINAAAHRKKTGQAARNIPLVIDEAAQIAHGQSFQDALVLSRKYGIRKHIIHQSEAQLRSARGTDMSQVVKDNCSIKAFFTTDTSIRGQELADLQGYSKDETVPRRGTSISGLRQTTSEQEHQEPVLKRNTVIDVNETFGEFFLIFKAGAHHEPRRLMSEFPTTLAKHGELSDRPLPQKPLAKNSDEALVTAARSSERPAVKDSLRANQLVVLTQLLSKLKQEERWKLSK